MGARASRAGGAAMRGGRVIIYPLCRRGAHCAPENTMPLAAPLRRAREGELPRNFVGRDDSVRQTGPIHDLGALCMPNHNGIFAAVRRRHTRGETRSFSPLANHPVFFGREQTYRSLPEDLRHLLPQIRARCARKSKSLFPPAAHLLQATRRVDSTPRGRCGSLLVGARIARPLPWGGIRSAYPARTAGRQSESGTYPCARSAPCRRGW